MSAVPTWRRDEARCLYVRSDGYTITDLDIANMRPEESQATFEWLEDETAEERQTSTNSLGTTKD